MGKQETNSVDRATSALVGYCMGSMVVVPFDRVKTLMQSAPGSAPSAWNLSMHVMKTDGIRGLYRGLDTQLLIAPYTVIYYSMYDELLHWQGNHALAPLYAACMARTIEVTLRNPLELLRTQLQAASGRLTLLELLRQRRHEPLTTWMRGLSPTLLRDVPFSAIYWLAYENSKKTLAVPDFFFHEPWIKNFCAFIWLWRSGWNYSSTGDNTYRCSEDVATEVSC